MFQTEDTVRGVLAQTLVPRVCEACGGVGCSVCSGTGFGGRKVEVELTESI